MRKLNYVWLLSIIFLGACSSITVKSDYDKDADFTQVQNL
jgi:hypothetical protein